MESTTTEESLYEQRLVTLYEALMGAFGEHNSHPIRPLSAIDNGWDPATARVCAQERRCDLLDGVIAEEIERAFPPSEYLSFLCPNLLDLSAGIDSRSGWRDNTPLRDVLREVVLQAIDYDIHTRRLFPNSAVWPIHPALTHPS